MRSRLILCFIISIVSGSVLFAQTIDRNKLDQYFDTLARHNRFMGSVALSRGDELIYSRSLGYANKATNHVANEQTVYRIGSISKIFTAVMVLKAVESKKLSLDQPIAKYFPNIKNASGITIKHLLQHRSGIHNFTDNDDYTTWNTVAKTEKEMLGIIIGGGIDFEPGARFSYSNSNYLLLTYILEHVYGRSYADLLKRDITVPLKLKNTYLAGKRPSGDAEAFSYKSPSEQTADTDTDPSIPLGAGAILSTPVELVHFADALFAGKLLSAESLGQMKELKDNYGLGLMAFPFYERKSLGHTGGIDHFTSVLVHFVEDNVSFAMCSNGADMNTNDISIAVLSAAFGKPYNMPVYNKVVLSETQLDSLTGKFKSGDISLEIAISRRGTALVGQVTGQPEFRMETVDRRTFQFTLAGVVITFSSDGSQFVLKQGGKDYNYTRINK